MSTTQDEKDASSLNNSFINQAGGYSIEIPDAFSEWTSLSKGLDGPSYPYFTSLQIEDSITIFDDADACSNSRLGTYENADIQFLSSQSAQWAKMRLYNAYDRPQETYCNLLNQISDECTYEELWDGTCDPQGAVYSFCAQKGDTAVAICLSQAKDDPEMAKQIFETFRWIE